MGIMHQSYRTGENVPKWIFILRIVLGLSLIWKAFAFFKDASELETYFRETSMLKNLVWMTAVIPWFHLIGGILILVGFFTRMAALIQIPILFGAVIFVNLKEGLYGSQTALPFSFLILVLVIAFSFVGGGYLSMDNKFRKPIDEV